MKARLLIAPSVAAALLATAVIAAPAASAAPLAKPCSPANLVVWAGPQAGGGTAGGFGYEIKFTNLGSATCTLAGFPGVRAVDLRGKRIGAAATHGPGKVKQIVLAPDQSAMATLQIADALNFPKSQVRADDGGRPAGRPPRRLRRQDRPDRLRNLRQGNRQDPLGQRRRTAASKRL